MTTQRPTPVYSTVIQAEFNQIAPGAYEWHRSRKDAEAVAFPGTRVVKTSPGLYRARVA